MALMVGDNWMDSQVMTIRPKNSSEYINHYPAKLIIKIFSHLKLCLTTATHNFK